MYIYNKFTMYTKMFIIQLIHFVVTVWKIYHDSVNPSAVMVQSYLNFELLGSEV
jgi:hypothetical protein